jgi:periplasmic divalent cation tolerance protein
MSAQVVLVTFPDRERALACARALVDEQLAACVNVVGEVRSIYRWQGAVHDDAEILCVIKTTAERFEALRARVVALHPYEVPEVIALPVTAGHQPYLDWLSHGVVSPNKR